MAPIPVYKPVQDFRDGKPNFSQDVKAVECRNKKKKKGHFQID